ncbi:MAG: epimerase [Bdellovibrio sp. CG12_big_fil_rev_8_21_14_0_65_39_13]|nr:MAG: epimerase [Bdellovibrio sp. CG22_combo_CG10-13_8_21_14_all_39_27]PIQ58764.1 MAG: epimerase [Bdellovibrio sp. CG12_big_fil_rev_8_21_14_0_65_39_13]PIR35555.1 MAG: epimerase [Bdellovibrio sp. CG11_big_fil_rev_8_21_14_0_20_39_38]PJB54309.1 MAG: DUF1304 domain-containing protein [Bdellovibrio sp. CG_4_9_14_3_um_filter_39_7]
MITTIFAIISALIHILFFTLESVVFTKKLGRTIFRMTEEQAQANRLFAFNQGFYNLFLALGIFASISLEKEALLIFCLSSMFLAGIVLVFSSKELWRGTVIQSIPPLIALLTLIF